MHARTRARTHALSLSLTHTRTHTHTHILTHTTHGYKYIVMGWYGKKTTDQYKKMKKRVLIIIM